MKLQQFYEQVFKSFQKLLVTHKERWAKAWYTVGNPRNAISDNTYNGVNLVTTLVDSIENEYRTACYITYKQAEQLGHQVLKGARATPVIRAGRVPVDRKKDKEAYTFLKVYHVFNVEQTSIKDDAEQMAKFIAREKPLNDSARHLDIIEASKKIGVRVIDKLGSDKCCYKPFFDHIEMESIRVFKDNESYVATLFHELAHATQTEHRTNRVAKKLSYAHEELVAELTSVFLGQHYNITPEIPKHHASYINSWLRSCQEKDKQLLEAFKMAGHASDWLIPRIDKALERVTKEQNTTLVSAA